MTCELAADDRGSHADVSVPAERVKADVASDERRVEVVNTLQILVNVATELLHTTSPAVNSNT